MEKEKQTRNAIDKIEIRSVVESADNSAIIEGYIAKFNSPSTLWQGYNEQLDPHCFDNTLTDGHNIFLLYAHDITRPLASTGTGSLVLNIDEIGLRFVATVDTSISYVSDTVKLIKSGLTVGCSFGFYILRDNEVYDAATDTVTDTILEVQLLEGSVLSNPQYTDTAVSARAKDKIEEYQQGHKRQEQDQRDIELIKIEMELD